MNRRRKKRRCNFKMLRIDIVKTVTYYHAELVVYSFIFGMLCVLQAGLAFHDRGHIAKKAQHAQKGGRQAGSIN
jgi:hypothetical protein